MFTTTRQGAVQVLSGKDAIVETTVDDLNLQLEVCLREVSPRVVLNLLDVPLIDGLGLEWLMTAAERCSERGGQMQLAAPNALCHDILTVTGVGDLFEKFPDVRAAVRSFNR